jgi:chorismate dehydratase
MTGLPFVFAVWVSNRELPPAFVQEFNVCLKESLSHMSELSDRIVFPDYDLHTYYHHNISYLLDQRKVEGMNLFMDYLRKENL